MEKHPRAKIRDCFVAFALLVLTTALVNPLQALAAERMVLMEEFTDGG